MFNSRTEDKYIFVGGIPRSGTTLVQNMLDSHPYIYGAAEFPHLKSIIELKQSMEASIERNEIDTICSRRQLQKNITDLIESFLKPLFKEHRCRYVSEKTPHNILIFDALSELFPKAKFIHVTRDPRGITASLLKVRERAQRKNLPIPEMTRNPSAAIQYIHDYMDEITETFKRMHTDVLTVRLEDLLLSPESETQRICRHLGCEWDRNMLYPHTKTHPAERAMHNRDQHAWMEPSLFHRPPDKSSADRWRTTLKQPAIALINAELGQHPYVKHNGYILDNKELSSLYQWLPTTMTTLYKMKSVLMPRSGSFKGSLQSS